MKCLVVISHPLENSLCRHLANRVAERLIEQEHEVVIQDLYAEDFKPSLSERERDTYYSEYDPSAVSSESKHLQEAEALILLFPTWWFGFPAILKGWFDRVWGPRIAFDHSENFGPIKPKLTKLKHVLAITTLGSPWWVDRLIMWRPLRKTLKTAILGTCTHKSKLSFLSLYRCENLTEKRLKRYEGAIFKAIDHWQ